MQDFWLNFGVWLKKYEKIAVLSGIFVIFAAIGAACLWKYAMYGYQGFDLAYFSQVFWNSVHGRFFQQSLHPHLSLGDHAELAILVLTPLFAIWQDPRMLLLMQAAALAACAWPVWRIAKFRLVGPAAGGVPGPVAGFAAALPLAMAAATLLNASLHNIALFEFHVLTFALFPLLMAVLAYEIGNKRAFVLWCLAALLVREDVSFVVFMMGLMAWSESRSKWWRWTPILLGAAWFVAAMLLVKHFAPAGSYKFRVYYAWLGETPWQMLTFPLRHPLQFAKHVFSFGSLEMFLGLMMPVAFLPLLRPRRLMLLLGPLAMILLGSGGGSAIVVQTHYAALFLPAVLLASIDGLAVAPAFLAARFRNLRFLNSYAAAGVALLLCAVYSTVTLGPLPAVAWQAATDDALRLKAAENSAVLQRIPEDAPVATSYALMPHLAMRESLTSLHYVALGVTQFAERPYTPPADLRYVALDAEDLLLYDAQFTAAAWAQPYHAGALDRIKAIIGPSVESEGSVALYDRHSMFAPLPPTDTGFAPGTAQNDTAASYAWTAPASKEMPGRIRITTSLGWWNVPAGAAVRYVVTDTEGRILLDRRMPAQAPLPWTSGNGGTTLRFEAALLSGGEPAKVEVLIEDIEGVNTLSQSRRTGLLVTSAETLLSITATPR